MKWYAFLYILFPLSSNILNSCTGTFQGHETCWISRILFSVIVRQADAGFPRNSNPFFHFKFMYTACDLLEAQINLKRWRGWLRGRSEAIIKTILWIVKSLVREILLLSGIILGFSKTNGCGDHVREGGIELLISSLHSSPLKSDLKLAWNLTIGSYVSVRSSRYERTADVWTSALIILFQENISLRYKRSCLRLVKKLTGEFMRVNELYFLIEYKILEGFVCWRHERAQ